MRDGKPFKAEAPAVAKPRSTKAANRLKRLRAKAYRAAMAQENAMVRIATQVRLMREKAGVSQAELAQRIGTKQGAIARLESTTYGKFSMATLHKIADYFDVAAWVEFVPFSTFIERTSDLSPEALTPAAYTEEFDDAGLYRV